jgi:hypothetical protein
MSNTAKSTDELPWFTADAGWFGENKASNDFVHREHPAQPYSISETYWFCFCDPHNGLTADFYTILRRNMNVALCGVWIYRGMERETPMTTVHYNVQPTLPLEPMQGNVQSSASFGLSFEITEPLQRATVRYRPQSGEAQADLHFDAVLPMVTTSKDDHYDQAMRCTGTLRLGNDIIAVDAPGFRDRTWGVARPEEPLRHPPLAYIWGIVDDGRIAFNFRIGDDPAGAPWATHYGLSNEQLFHGGWLQIDGSLRAIVKASRKTVRDPKNMNKPIDVRIDFEDNNGEQHVLTGRPRSSMWFMPWGNVFAWFEHMDWILDGKSGSGQVQDCTWPEFCKRYWD